MRQRSPAHMRMNKYLKHMWYIAVVLNGSAALIQFYQRHVVFGAMYLMISLLSLFIVSSKGKS